ncbi:MAG TPA: hypothetical protein VM597_26575 [Gemmataceae bacterium]|nr:hypothetical protein [Gemmataceae bacterium]
MAKPTDATLIPLARFAARDRRLPAPAAALYAAAFQTRPRRAADVRAGHRYDAACAAARAAADDRLAQAARGRWRRQALEWLRADLTDWAELGAQDADARADAAARLAHWREDPDLVAVRDDSAVRLMPPGDRDAARALWADADAALKRLAAAESD